MRKALSLSLALFLAGAVPLQAAAPIVGRNAGRGVRGSGAIQLQLNFTSNAPKFVSGTGLPLLTPGLNPSPLVNGAQPELTKNVPGAAQNFPLLKLAETGADNTNSEAQPQGDKISEEGSLDAARNLANTSEDDVEVKAAQRFDGAELKKPETEAVWIGQLKAAGAGIKASLKAAVKTGFQKAKPKGLDEYNGPEHQPKTAKETALYGLKWGLNMTGLATIIGFVLKPVLALFPWQLRASPELLESTGRVELLRGLGPEQIEQVMQSSPWTFMLTSMPMMVMVEELTFRVLQFGLIYLALAAVKPLSIKLKEWLNALPKMPARSLVQKALGLTQHISALAFPLAAYISTKAFAAAHVAAWGYHPFTLAVHFALGWALVHVAYRTRGLAAPFIAHFTYNFLSLLGAALMLYYGMPIWGTLYGIVLTLAGLATLWYTIRTSWNFKPGKLLGAALISMAIAIGAWSGGDIRESARPHASVTFQNQTPQDTTKVPADTVITAPKPAVDSTKTDSTSRPVYTVPELVRMAKPAVVQVKTPNGTGSGFIITEDGFLVTNEHVVQHFDEVIIMLANRQEVTAKVVARNADKDIAFVQLPPATNGWAFVKLSQDSTLIEGEPVVAMGYPWGLPFSVNNGIISGLGFRGNLYVSWIQHDAAINPGNSGGALLSERGEVIGMNNAGQTSGGGYDGVSYAISALDIQRAREQYNAMGHINSSWLGVILDLNVQGGLSKAGVYVDAVRPGSPAALAGLRAGDIIIGTDTAAFEGDGEQAVQTFAKKLAMTDPNTAVKFVVIRQTQTGSDRLVLTVAMGEKLHSGEKKAATAVPAAK